MGLLGAIEWLVQRRLAALALSVIGTDDGLSGIGGETGALLAVVDAPR